MERTAWITLKRRETEERMDTLFAPIYDQDWGAVIDPIHRRFVTAIAAACPPGSSIPDAACGTGKYWPILLECGCNPTGIDQSQGMLVQAKAKFPVDAYLQPGKYPLLAGSLCCLYAGGAGF